MITRNTPHRAILEFSDSRQTMLQRFWLHLDRVAQVKFDCLDFNEVQRPHWPGIDGQVLVVWRLLARNRRDLARAACAFATTERARRNAQALVPVTAAGRLETHVVRAYGHFTWYLSLFGTPALVGVTWYPGETAAITASDAARKQLADAVVSQSSKRLLAAATGPLALSDSGAPRFPLLPAGVSRPESGMPAPADLGTGTREYHNLRLLKTA